MPPLYTRLISDSHSYMELLPLLVLCNNIHVVLHNIMGLVRV